MQTGGTPRSKKEFQLVSVKCYFKSLKTLLTEGVLSPSTNVLPALLCNPFSNTTRWELLLSFTKEETEVANDERTC